MPLSSENDRGLKHCSPDPLHPEWFTVANSHLQYQHITQEIIAILKMPTVEWGYALLLLPTWRFSLLSPDFATIPQFSAYIASQHIQP